MNVNAPHCGPARRILFALCLSLIALPSLANADGREFNLNAHDLSLNVDSRWAGCAYGGYYPIRIRIVNRGPSANLTFRFEAAAMRDNSLPSVERSIGAEQNATVNFTLSVPMVGQGENGTLRVFHEGEEVDEFRTSLALPSPSRMGEARPSVLAISSSPVDFSALDTAEGVVLGNSVDMQSTTGVRSGGSRAWSVHTSSVNLSSQVVSPSMLPDKWLDYTGLDMVIVELATLEKIDPEPRRALIEWVETGGMLLVSNVGEPAEQSEKLKKLLDLDARASISPDWEPADPRARAQFLTMQNFNTVPGGRIEGFVASNRSEPASADAFARRRLMQGSVFAFRGDPFHATPAEWGWFLTQVGADELHWPSKNGVSPRGTNDDFLDFLIPGVTGVHTTAFLILITLFTAIIGPLNYFYVARRKQQYLLLITIPACALITSLTLFGYSAVAHGFHIKSRARSLTIVDQKNRTAVTNSRIALFAGMAPSHGLQFSESTAVYPLWPYLEGFDSGHVDWTGSQAMPSGWLQSRTQTQFVTTSHRIERGRLEVEPPAQNSVRVSNGFEWDFEALVVADDKGQLYSIGDLPAGAVGELPAATPESLSEVRELLERYPLEPPETIKVDRADSTEMFDVRWNPSRAFRVVADNDRGPMEQLIKQLGQRPLTLKPRSYLAILKRNPGVQLGVENTDERAGYHILLGFY